MCERCPVDLGYLGGNSVSGMLCDDPVSSAGCRVPPRCFVTEQPLKLISCGKCVRRGNNGWRVGVGRPEPEVSDQRDARGHGLELVLTQDPEPELAQGDTMSAQQAGHPVVGNRRLNDDPRTEPCNRKRQERALGDDRHRSRRSTGEQSRHGLDGNDRTLHVIEPDTEEDVAFRDAARLERARIDRVGQPLSRRVQRAHRRLEIRRRVHHGASRGKDMSQISADDTVWLDSPDVASVTVDDIRAPRKETHGGVRCVVDVNEIERARTHVVRRTHQVHRAHGQCQQLPGIGHRPEWLCGIEYDRVNARSLLGRYQSGGHARDIVDVNNVHDSFATPPAGRVRQA